VPLQNRVAPDGTIFATPARGLFMGNRGGQMHTEQKVLTSRRWASRQWISCVLQYKDRHETIMAPGRYTQLFFLDEATALAAGHRPCALCRRADFLTFMGHWQALHALGARPKVADVDGQLHQERVGSDRGKRTYPSQLAKLAAGAMIASAEGPQLYFAGRLWPWTASGYGPPQNADGARTVDVLTPPSLVAVLAEGYAPVLHPSAYSISAARS
jgi:hypothetical protein